MSKQTGAVIVDTETSGFDAKTKSIIELAELVIPGTPAQFLDELSGLVAEGQLYSPVGTVDLGAISAHHILPSDLAGKPQFVSYVLPDEAYAIIGHNIDFDVEFLGTSETIPRICTLAMARHIWPELDSHNQTALIYMIGFRLGDPEWARERVQGAHRATRDVENCGILLKYMLTYLRDEKGITFETWADVHKFSEKARVPLMMTFGKYKGQPIRNVDAGWAKWYAKQEDTDKYVIKALRNEGIIA